MPTPHFATKIRAMLDAQGYAPEPGVRLSIDVVVKALGVPDDRAHALAIGHVLRERGFRPVRSNGVRYFLLG